MIEIFCVINTSFKIIGPLQVLPPPSPETAAALMSLLAAAEDLRRFRPYYVPFSFNV